MARPPPGTVWVLLGLALLLLPAPALGIDRVGYNLVGTCTNATDEPGELFVTTVPASSAVFVDDTKVGESSAAVPGTFRASFSPGEHKVEVAKASYRTYTFSACITNGKITYAEAQLEFLPPTPPPTPTPAQSPSPAPSPTPTPTPTPEPTRPPVTAPSLLAFLDDALADGQVPESEEIALRAALDRLRASGNASPAAFTPANASCRAIAASILRQTGGCAGVNSSRYPIIQSACCSLAGPTTTPAPRKSPGFEATLAFAAIGVAALLARRGKR